MALFAPAADLQQVTGLTLAVPEAIDAARLPFGVLALLASLPLSYGLIRLGACFRGFSRHDLFSRATISGLRDFAAAIFFWALCRPFFVMLFALVLSWGAPAGKRQLVLQLSSDSILLVVFALCVLIVSWVLTEASALSEENEQFV